MPLMAITLPLVSLTMPNPERALPMLPVADHVPLVGSYRSHVLRIVVPVVPPQASTLPLPSAVAPKSARALLIDPVDDHDAATRTAAPVTIIPTPVKALKRFIVVLPPA